MKKISRIKVCVSGGDKITAEELLKMEHVIGKPILNGYGNNEMCGAAIISPVYASKPDSVGIPLKNVDVAAFDPETHQKLDDGEIGEICLKSDNIFVEYLNNVEETKKIKKVHSDGMSWVHTGDLGYIDSEGYVYIVGRSKRLILRNAFKISPDTIENVILQIPEVNDCVVVGVPDFEELFVPFAYIELKKEFIDDENKLKEKILLICSEELPEYEIPKYIQMIEKIPYKNNKKSFSELEEKGKEYIEKNNTKKLLKTN